MKHIHVSKVFTAGLLFLSFSGFTNVAESKKLRRDNIFSILSSDSTANMSEIKDLSEQPTTEQEQNLLNIWAAEIDKDNLKLFLNGLVTSAMNNEKSAIGQQLKNLPKEKREYAVDTAVISIESIVKLRGLTKDSTQNANNYKEWSVLSDKMIKRLDKSAKMGLEDAIEFSGSQWVTTEKAELLVDGPASFAKRTEIMNNAKNEINILTWSVYDDDTGAQLTQLLNNLKQANKELKIRIVVDGNVARQAGHSAELEKMKKIGVEVIYWKNLSHSYLGQHRKMIIVDNEHLIAGGLNYGDAYSHLNITVLGWRDTDVYLKGAAALEGNKLFAEIWNQQVKQNKEAKNKQAKNKQEKYAEIDISNIEKQMPTAQSSNGIKVSIINHDPVNSVDNSIHHKNNVGSTILMTTLKAIRSAEKTIDIENAYVVLFPGLKKEIEDAIKRNVKVRVLTNSPQSVDEPAVSIPILRSAKKLAEVGADVYLRKGTTLHSKLMVVDSKFSMIMSYNLHPRSERFEGEMAIAVLDKDFSTNLVKVFEDDIATDKADQMINPAAVPTPSSAVSPFVLRLFYDDL